MIKWLKAIFFLVPYFCWSYFRWILPYSMNVDKYPLELRWKRVRRLCQLFVKYFGIEYDKDAFYKTKEFRKNALFVCNHTSFVDPVIFIVENSRPLTFISKIESRKFFMVGRIIRIIDGMFIDRSDLKQSFRTMKKIEDFLNSETPRDVIIFPEGTRNRDPYSSLLEYHYGSFKNATKTKANIEYFYQLDSHKILSMKSNKLKNKIYFKHLGTLTYDDYKDMSTVEVAETIRDATEKELNVLKEKVKNL